MFARICRAQTDTGFAALNVQNLAITAWSFATLATKIRPSSHAPPLR
jgi:hypothetical protein